MSEPEAFEDGGSAVRRRLMVCAALALVSGGPALVYQVVWTREIGLLIGSQVEAISTVIAIYFAGLAAGARLFGGVADRAAAPLRLYGMLEIFAGVLAGASPLLLRGLGERVTAGGPGLMIPAGALLLIVTVLLGGTLPALLRAVTGDAAAAPKAAGWIVGVNTAGAVGGVIAAALFIPLIGLQLSAWIAGGTAVVVGIVAILLGRPVRTGVRAVRPPRSGLLGGAPPAALLVAAVGGVGTLSFEVLAARGAALWLGSSLLAWAVVLALFLVGLALGNMLIARRAGTTERPGLDLALIEGLAAVLVTAGVAWALPLAAAPAIGVGSRSLLSMAAWIVPPTVLMGAAFPLYVRLALRPGQRVGAVFGAVSAANTGGGIGGALLAPFLILPGLGLEGGMLACAAINALLAMALLWWSAPRGAGRVLRPAAFALLTAGAAALALLAAEHRAVSGPRLIHVSHGPQATAAVAHPTGRRDLLVDGDPEASTGGDARITEELLGALPLMLHPSPERFLEVGLGSGITLSAAAGFDLERLECVEIAEAVLDCAPYFAPDNEPVASGADARITIMHGDGRAWLLRRQAAYDVIVANTLHPWSVGATGLYSREYFGRIRRALRPGGIAAQWVPIDRIGADHLAAVLRTFFTVFPDGELWWGAGNVIVIGRLEASPPAAVRPERFELAAERLRRQAGIDGIDELRSRWLAGADVVLETIGAGLVLSDDRPVLEARGSTRRGAAGGHEELALIASIAEAQSERAPAARPIALWLASGAARAAGRIEEADLLEGQAAALGLPLVRQKRAQRHVLEALEALELERFNDARLALGQALSVDRLDATARYLMAVVALRTGDGAASLEHLRTLLLDHPGHAPGWYLLAELRLQRGELGSAREAIENALSADPFLPEALALAGWIAVEAGERDRAQAMLQRLEALSGSERWAETRRLREKIAR